MKEKFLLDMIERLIDICEDIGTDAEDFEEIIELYDMFRRNNE